MTHGTMSLTELMAQREEKGGLWCPMSTIWCNDSFCRHINCRLAEVDRLERIAADVLNKAFRVWSDGGGTGLVQWTGDLGPGLQIEMTKEK